MSVARTVRPVHFEDFSGTKFERLVFAYHLCDGWADLAWFGQTGSDQGRDLVGKCPFDDQPDERTVIQCVNRGSLSAAGKTWIDQIVRRVGAEKASEMRRHAPRRQRGLYKFS